MKLNFWRFFLYIIFWLASIGFIVLMVILSGKGSYKSREYIQGIWLLNVNDNNFIITYADKHYDTRRSSGYTYHIRLIEIETGKIESEFKSSQQIEMQFFTKDNLWIYKDDLWNCLELPSLKIKWTQEAFYKYMEQTYPEVGTVHTVDFENDSFEVTNNSGEKFSYSPTVFDEHHKKTNSETYITICNEDNELGNLTYYPISKNTPVYLKINNDPQLGEQHPVCTPDSSCLVLQGDDRKSLKILTPKSPKLQWITLFNDKVWLQGEFFRPFKKSEEPRGMLVTSYQTIVFILYNTSLNQAENRAHLSAIDYINEKIVWDINLYDLKVGSGYYPDKHIFKPRQNFIFNQILITLWRKTDTHNGGYKNFISGINVKTGNVIWTVAR